MKALIETTHGQDAATQKLIAYGKVMDDEAKTVQDYKIVENGFIVMMVAKVSSLDSYYGKFISTATRIKASN